MQNGKNSSTIRPSTTIQASQNDTMTPPVSPGGISGSSVFKLPISPQQISTTELSFQAPQFKSNFWLPPTPPNGMHQDNQQQPPSLQSTVAIKELNTNYEQLHFDASSHMANFSNGQSSEIYASEYNFSVSSSNISAKPIMYHHTSIIQTIPPRPHHNQLVPTDEPLSLAEKRELARKIAHSAIERRRRERINDKIVQLQKLVPSCAEQPQIHKMAILQGAIDYICYLQGLLAEKRKLENNSRNNDNEDDGRF
ncbi:10880_t:CDS:1, partial [Ambispora leptoticha]